MTDLSPAAQAVVNAAVDVTGYGKETPLLKTRLAAALRALADQVVPACSALSEEGTWQLLKRHEILAIAAELEGAE